ncbi:hypothetical protein K505DRAFT_420809 [Melanomma pulvis-pyrius CBS 109.77]|uniref:Uncharacterized protein n=1 Tax=Melanomma pulvis-pyrius CBS 109.77 TaxID=1314802 RepID=A0A6A6WXU2_9PLEO|nr:hypothetical protein K505DRAFT_420809 [Melanomma pulvis-pyrius CBS 109.77]
MEDTHSNTVSLQDNKKQSQNVPPTWKLGTSATSDKLLPCLPSQRPPIPRKEFKPLPPPPHPTSSELLASKSLPPKPLPGIPTAHANPKTPNYIFTLYWIALFGVWFLIIILLLPVVMEKDAMPGLNRLLRRWIQALTGGTKDETWTKDEI